MPVGNHDRDSLTPNAYKQIVAVLLHQWGTHVRERGGVTCSPCALHGDRVAVKQQSALGPSWREKKALEGHLPLWEQDLTMSSPNQPQMWRSGWILLFLECGTLLLFLVKVLVSPVSVTRMCPPYIHTIHRTHVHTHSHTWPHTCAYKYTICTSTHAYIHTHTHIHVYT